MGMNVGELIYSIIVSPIELIVELLFVFFHKAFDNLGLSIAAISFLVSLLSLPLYHIAEQLQKKERDARIAMQPGIARIKSVFTGDEQYMILSTFYRQNHYHPAFALRSSVSLLIQVPFFIAAYHFLSHLPQLRGESFLFIQDLGASDGLLQIGGFSINVLPIAMTVINIVAGAVYTKGFPLRDKVQLYAMAGLFLVLLYNSPAALVYYWTLNNVFSLVKNIFYKLKHPMKILYWLAVIGSVVLAIAVHIAHPTLSSSNRIILVAIPLFVCSLPLVLKITQKVFTRYLSQFYKAKRDVAAMYVQSSLLLALACGILVPASLILSSPIEFAFTGEVANPISYVMGTGALFIGLWLIWPLFIYSMSSKKVRGLMAYVLLVLALTSIANLYLFSGKYETVNKLLLFDNPSLLDSDMLMTVIPVLVAAIVAGLGLFLIRKRLVKLIISGLTILVLAAGVSGLYSVLQINAEYKQHVKNLQLNADTQVDSEHFNPVVSFSKEGQNVFVFFLDRAISSFFPLILDQFPELREQFSGFTYYPNTISFGPSTITGAPPIMGGYEYTPDAMNARADEKLVTKHNEATLVLPRIFSEAGYAVTFVDPPFANYKWASDFTAFRPYPEIDVMQMEGSYSLKYKKEHQDVLNWDPTYESVTIMSRLPIFSILKTTFPLLRKTLYDSGKYFLMNEDTHTTDDFVDAYSSLYYLPKLTSFTSEQNTFTIFVNDTAHEPVFLQAPDYVPSENVTNTYSPLAEDGYPKISQMSYHANAAAILKIGEWLDYLKENGVYDNTRIIIVADHGKDILTPAFKDFTENGAVLGSFNPLLLVKDFSSSGPITEDFDFMTNADVPSLVLDKLPLKTVNPFTGKDIFSSVDKISANAYFVHWDPKKNLGTQFSFDSNRSFTVHDSIFIEENWTPIQH